MKKVLIVEDDDFFRVAIKNILSKKYEVIEASNGKAARELLQYSTFDLVLSDIQMPHLSGVELLEWIKANKPTPVILMTGFAQILETQKAHDLGADDFLPKPFRESELLEKASVLLKEAPEAPPETKEVDLDLQFCKVPIDDFMTERQADYGIYIRITNKKYIKIAHEGGKLSPEKIGSYREKGLDFLYIRQEDFPKLVGFTVLFSKAVNNSQQVDRVKKLHFVQYTGEMIMQQAFVAGTDEAVFKNARDFLSNTINMISDDPQTFGLLNQLSTHTDFLYAHSLGVSLFSVMIARQMGLQSVQSLFKISFAGLFHDIGKKEIPKEILMKGRAALTQEERSLLESHATRGKEILESLQIAPSEVIQVAYEHHEDILGQGFPQGLLRGRIHPMTLIVSVANIFCNYTIKSPNNPTPLSAQGAIVVMRQNKLAIMDKQAFEALERVVQSQAGKAA
jgi:putative nucleotidyltransferase with HDIG domain